MDLISVIVPVYNVEKYLERCVESIVNQTYTNLEIILVDDGSPDNCPEMCDEWAKKDSRIKVIHKENGGLSDARNFGMDAATGEYIAFIDSDDWIHKDYIHFLYDAINISNAVISACGVTVTKKTLEDCNLDMPIVNSYSTEEALKTLLHGQKFRAVVWNKLYKSELLEGEKFELGKYHEDEFFTYRILAKAEKLCFAEADLYFYYQRTGSIINSFSEKHLESLEAHLRRIEFLRAQYPDLYKEDKKIFCRSCLYYYHICKASNNVSKQNLIRKVKEYRSQIMFNFSELKDCGIKDLLYIFATKYCLGLFDFLFYIGRKEI